ncbi:MAG: FAD-dependent monooxygenase [Alphaproteobacteria bacterium]
MTKHTTPKPSIIVVGSGPIGLSAALAFAQTNAQVTLLEAKPKPNPTQPLHDLRATALNQQSQKFLSTLGLENHLAQCGQPINAVVIAQAQLANGIQEPILTIQSKDNSPSGLMIPNRKLISILAKQVQNHKNIKWKFNARVQDWKPLQNHGEVTLNSGLAIQANLIIAADGAKSAMRQLANIKMRQHQYPQTAFIGTIVHEKPHKNIALELFLREGPLAFLPLQGQKSAFVWSLHNTLANTITKDPDTLLSEIFNPLIHERLGNCQIQGQIQSWPLTLTRARHFTAPRLALVGDAARAIHPVAGQGFNLGLRDLRDLHTLAAKPNHDPGNPHLLARFSAQRRRDSLALTAFTDGIVRLFAAKHPAIAQLRTLGLVAVNHNAGAKQFFLNAAGGLAQ